MNNVDIRLRVSSEIKKEAEAVFHDMGMSISEAIRIFLKQSINCHGMPFRPHANHPNRVTLDAFAELDRGDYHEETLDDFKKSLKLG